MTDRTNAHSQAQLLAAEAASKLRKGEAEAARLLYYEAAELEDSAFSSVAPDLSRTRGILAVSAVALYFKASELRRAEHLALELLAGGSLPDFAQDELRNTLEVIWEEKILSPSGHQMGQEAMMISLRGSEVGMGRAPLGLVVDKIAGVNSLLYRVTEWLGDFPFRTRGAPPRAVQELCQPWVGEPQAGSFRFALRFIGPLQMELLPSRLVTPSQISRSLLEILSSVSPTSWSQSASLEEIIPDLDYRQAVLKLIRNITPDGQSLREIEFQSREMGYERTALLHVGARTRIQDALRNDKSVETPDEIRGVLRAIHLDKGWVEVAPESGLPVRCGIARQVLDDVIGPMLNRLVIGHGQWTPKQKQFNLQDIELDVTGGGNAQA